jgi:hypothetical protein
MGDEMGLELGKNPYTQEPTFADRARLPREKSSEDAHRPRLLPRGARAAEPADS